MTAWFKRLFSLKPKRYYGVGDVAPDSLLNREPGTNIGAFIRIEPETKIIKEIFIP